MDSIVKVEKKDSDIANLLETSEKSDLLDPVEVDLCDDDAENETEWSQQQGQSTNEITWSHQEAMAKFHAGLSDCLQNDPYLNNLPDSITLEEINLQISLEHGQAITVYVKREDGQTLPVVVDQNGTVWDLKKAIRRHMEIKLTREGGPEYISWKSVWKSYWLQFGGDKLTKDEQTLKMYGIGNMCEVSFIKRLSK